MKTVKPVSDETYEKIGQAFVICSEYPEVFGGVTLKKFCSMFVDDIIDEGEDAYQAVLKAYAPEMHSLLKEALMRLKVLVPDSALAGRIEALLEEISGVCSKEVFDDE